MKTENATKYAEPTAEWVVITPAVASEWLEKHNTHNRPIRETIAKRYSDEMLYGTWKQNSVPIIFGWNGVLLDGQHRLWAIVISGIAVKMLVVRGVDPACQDTIDVNEVRQLKDRMALSGMKDPYGTSIVVNAIAKITFHRHGRGSRPNEATVHQILKKWGAGVAFVAPHIAQRTRSLFRSAFWGAVAIAYQSFPKEVAGFVTAIVENDALAKGTPVHTLRATLEKEHRFGAMLNATFSTLRAHIEGKELQHVKRKPTSARAFFAIPEES